MHLQKMIFLIGKTEASKMKILNSEHRLCISCMKEHRIDIIETEMPATQERDEVLLFVKDSKRGIIRGYFPD